MINKYINQIRIREQEDGESNNQEKLLKEKTQEALLISITKKADESLLKMEISSYGLFKSKRNSSKNLHEGLNYHIRIHTYKKNEYSLLIQLLDKNNIYLELQKSDNNEVIHKKTSVEFFLESDFEKLMVDLFQSLDKNYPENLIINEPKMSWFSAFLKKYIKKNQNI
ncbi:hypothetical protein [Chryseobacterium sp. Mn2064]|uniref:hypothetical protein n=1 Tax=Chryseobacterium sp. Mn2064 TaxID=3395263 RepID=UPI003BC6B8FA